FLEDDPFAEMIADHGQGKAMRVSPCSAGERVREVSRAGNAAACGSRLRFSVRYAEAGRNDERDGALVDRTRQPASGGERRPRLAGGGVAGRRGLLRSGGVVSRAGGAGNRGGGTALRGGGGEASDSRTLFSLRGSSCAARSGVASAG